MARQSSSLAQSVGSSSLWPHTYAIGYAMLPNKHDTFVQPSFIDLASQHGIRLVPIDASRPLVEQGPFDLVVHKLYGQPWRTQLEAFSVLHPAVPIIDPPAAIERILDRFTMLDDVSGLDVAKEGTMATPRQVIVSDATALADGAADDAVLGGLRFPLIAKPVGVDDSAESHQLCLVYRREGLHGLRAPLVLQEFVNHGGVLFQVYVVGDHATCVTQTSLPNVPDECLQDLSADAAVPFSNISLLAPTTAVGSDDSDKIMPPKDFVDRVTRQLRRAVGLHLINFDLIRTKGTDGDNKYLILDINYCPGYSKMPGFELVLNEFFLGMLRSRPLPVQGGVEARMAAKLEAKASSACSNFT